MSVKSRQIKKKLFQKTGRCYQHNEKFSLTSMENENFSEDFNFFCLHNNKNFLFKATQ